MTLGTLIGLLILAGILVFVVQRAPFIAAEWKSYISYAILLIVVVVLVGVFFGGWGRLTNIRVGG
jgi:hypothetical protein